MIAPAAGQVASAFGIHSDVILALTTSIFVLAYGKPVWWMLGPHLSIKLRTSRGAIVSGSIE
jgi:hypothetical protein